MKQQIFIDASSLKEAGGCPRKWFWNSVIGIQPIGQKSVNIEYGNAFHYFLKDYYDQKLSIRESITNAAEYFNHCLNKESGDNIIVSDEEFRTVTHLIKSCNKYTERYPRDSDLLIPILSKSTGEPLTEKKFSIPWFHTDKYEFILCGTIDLIASFDSYRTLVDHKSTGTLFSKADLFFAGFQLDVQVLMYIWIYTKYNNFWDNIPRFLVNGIFIKKPTIKNQNLGIFDGVEFKRSGLIEITKEKLEVFEAWLERWKTTTLDLLEKGIIEETMNLNNCNAQYGLCKYFKICKSPKELQSNIIESSYTRIPYNPLTFRD